MTFGTGNKAWSLSPFDCHQGLTQSSWRLMGWSPHGSYILSWLFCALAMGASLRVFPAAPVSTPPVQPISIHQQQRPLPQQKPDERLTAPNLIRAVSTVVHPITPLVAIDPVLGVTAAENQVSRQAVGQVTCEGHTGHGCTG